MPTLMIRDVPEAVHAALEKFATRHRRSKEKQALFLIEQAVSAATVDWTDFLAAPRRTVRDTSDEIRKASR